MAPGTRARRFGWPLALPLILLLAAALACNLTTGDEEDEATTTATAVGAAGAPTVTILAPDDGAEVLLGTEVLVYALASDPVGVTRVELVAGETVIAAQASPDLETGETEFRVLLRWMPGTTGQQTLDVVPWRGDQRGTPASITLNVRARVEEITQTPPPTLPFLTPTRPADRTCRVQVTVGALNVRRAPSRS